MFSHTGFRSRVELELAADSVDDVEAEVNVLEDDMADKTVVVGRLGDLGVLGLGPVLLETWGSDKGEDVGWLEMIALEVSNVNVTMIGAAVAVGEPHGE